MWSRTRDMARVAGTEMGNFFPEEDKIPAIGKGVQADLAAFGHCLETLVPFGSTHHGEEWKERR